MFKTLVTAFLITSAISSTSYAAKQNCASDAEAEYSVPVGLLSVMSAQEVSRPKDTFYGPMRLYKGVIPFAASGIGATENEIKTNPCQNYRGAAWLLMNKFGGKDTKDIFTAVNVYYYGTHKKEFGPVTINIRKLYQGFR
ncbi:twitching motility protein PilT [Erwinia amylovora]|nr:twitching motility protein PilT [Erwinia amylovora]